MRIAILIHVHKNPQQVERLCNTLRHPNVDLYVNVDLKSDIATWKATLKDVNFIDERTKITWGGFSQVEATLNSLSQITSSEKYKYIVFISGQDYPIISIDKIFDRLTSSDKREYIAHILPDSDSPYHKKMRARYEYHHCFTRNLRLTHILNSFLKLFSLKRRTPPATIYKGSSWWNITGDCAKYIVDYCDKNPQYVNFFKSVLCADEMFFQSIILNSPYAENVENEIFRYIDWSAGGRSPKTLTKHDFPSILKSDKWFARKLDMEIDQDLFNLIDENR